LKVVVQPFGIQFWLDAQESRRSAEKALIGNRLNRYNNMMALYKALGGDPRLPGI
jgi:outer membrane protein TolC